MTELSFTDRFFTALKVTSKHYFKDTTVLSILYAILDDYQNNKAKIYGRPISKKVATEIKNFFIMVFQDDENVGAFINNEISEMFWQKEKAKRRDFDETQAIIDIIVTSKLSDFFND
ncbi:hypothetical protein [uncultured Chryseobacterium sp.]|uniref:hypothetical protein n=1 Tax=uncultured Chryseobacterium sp. TaxID=259322 RepID=UPI0025D6E2AF|nr:hypothetical protein [uncultured Chryseobacterium sp.]